LRGWRIMQEGVSRGNDRPVQKKAEADVDMFDEGRSWHSFAGAWVSPASPLSKSVELISRLITQK